jgi:hypothetical protein
VYGKSLGQPYNAPDDGGDMGTAPEVKSLKYLSTWFYRDVTGK